MNVFVFSSKTLTNIWAGIGAQMWAVADTENPTTFQGRLTKSKNMKIGSFGILYCMETHALTTPFIVYSAADSKSVIENVWRGKWVLPFKIHPLGTPIRQLKARDAVKTLPIFKTRATNKFSKVFRVQAVTAFVPSEIQPEDWELLLSHLVDRT